MLSIAVRPALSPRPPTKRLTARLTMIAVVAMCFLPSRSFACDLVSTSPWFWTEPELVTKTALIFVGQVVAVRPGTGDTSRADYEVEIVEQIKGTTPSKRVWLEQFAPPAAVAWNNPSLAAAPFMGRTAGSGQHSPSVSGISCSSARSTRRVMNCSLAPTTPG